MAVRSRAVLVAAVGLCAAAILLFRFDAPTLSGLHPPARIALDVTASITAAMVAFIVYARYRESRYVGHVLLGAGLTLLSLSNFVFSVLPAVREGNAIGPDGAPVLTGLAAAFAFAVATWTPRQLGRPPYAWSGWAITVLVVGGGFAAALRLGSLVPSSAAGSADTFGATPDSVVSACQWAAAGLFVVASVGATRRAGRDGDVLMEWLAVGTVFAAASRACFALATGPATPWEVVGAAFRLAFYLFLLAGAVQEVQGYWRRATQVAVLEERRRIARDLHDGVAQELAFIASQSRMVASRPNTSRAMLVSASAERALDESRRAIAALTRPLDEPLDVVLAQEAEEVASRTGARVTLELEAGVHVSADTREALLRIAREAVTNAGRHARAQNIAVRLDNHNGVTLVVRDDGQGFDIDASATQSGKFGLTSMRERAQALGGRLSLTSAKGAGTTVEVWLP